MNVWKKQTVRYLVNGKTVKRGTKGAKKRTTERQVSYFLHAIPPYTGMRRGEVLRLTSFE
jgi:integrase